MMNPLDLERAYTDFCHELGKAGEDGVMRSLSRFALLAMLEIGDPGRIRELIRTAVGAPAEE